MFSAIPIKKKSCFIQSNSWIALSKNEKQVLAFNMQLGEGVQHSISREILPGQYEPCPCAFMKIKKRFLLVEYPIALILMF